MFYFMYSPLLPPDSPANEARSGPHVSGQSAGARAARQLALEAAPCPQCCAPSWETGIWGSTH